MSRKKWHIPAEAATQSSQIQRKGLRESFAQQKPIVFGFRYIDLDRNKFSCNAGQGESLIKVFKCFCQFSQYNQIQMGTTKNYHPLDEVAIKKNKLQDLQSKSPSQKLHQLGKQRNPERIVGFFERDPNNLFQVCILDLEHRVYPQH